MLRPSGSFHPHAKFVCALSHYATSLVLLHVCAVALIVTEKGNGAKLCRRIDALTSRGATILPAQGGYRNDEKEVVMCTGSYKEIYAIRRDLKTFEPSAFTIILDSKEVQGEGFEIQKVAGETE